MTFRRPDRRALDYVDDLPIEMLAELPEHLRVAGVRLQMLYLLDYVHLDSIEGIDGRAVTTVDHMGHVSVRDQDLYVSARTTVEDAYITWAQADQLLARVAPLQAQIPLELHDRDVDEAVRQEILTLELQALASALRELDTPVSVRFLDKCVYIGADPPPGMATAILAITRRCAVSRLYTGGTVRHKLMHVDEHGVQLTSA